MIGPPAHTLKNKSHAFATKLDEMMRWHFSRGPRGTVVRGDLARLRRRRLAADPARLEQNRLDPLVPVFVLGVVRGARRVAAPDERAGAVLPPAAPDLARRDPVPSHFP